MSIVFDVIKKRGHDPLFSIFSIYKSLMILVCYYHKIILNMCDDASAPIIPTPSGVPFAAYGNFIHLSQNFRLCIVLFTFDFHRVVGNVMFFVGLLCVECAALKRNSWAIDYLAQCLCFLLSPE